MSVFKLFNDSIKKITNKFADFTPPDYIRPGGEFGQAKYESTGEAIAAAIAVLSEFYERVFKKLSDEDKIKFMAWFNHEHLGLFVMYRIISLTEELRQDPEFDILAHKHVLEFCAEKIGDTPILGSRHLYYTIGYEPELLLSMTLDREVLQHNYYTNEELEEMAKNQNSDGLLKNDYDAVYVLIYDLDKPKFECMSKDELISYFKNMGIDLNEWFYGAKAGLKILAYQKAMLDLEESKTCKEIVEWAKTLSFQDIENMVKEIEKSGIKEIKLGANGDLYFANPLFRMVTNITNGTRFSKKALRSEEIINVLAYKHLYQIKHPSFNLDVLESYANKYPDIESYRKKVKEVNLIEKPTNLCPSYFVDYLSLKYIEQINPKAIERLKKLIPEFGMHMNEVDEIYKQRQARGLDNGKDKNVTIDNSQQTGNRKRLKRSKFFDE